MDIRINVTIHKRGISLPTHTGRLIPDPRQESKAQPRSIKAINYAHNKNVLSYVGSVALLEDRAAAWWRQN